MCLMPTTSGQAAAVPREYSGYEYRAEALKSQPLRKDDLGNETEPSHNMTELGEEQSMLGLDMRAAVC